MNRLMELLGSVPYDAYDRWAWRIGVTLLVVSLCGCAYLWWRV